MDISPTLGAQEGVPAARITPVPGEENLPPTQQPASSLSSRLVVGAALAPAAQHNMLLAAPQKEAPPQQDASAPQRQAPPQQEVPPPQPAAAQPGRAPVAAAVAAQLGGASDFRHRYHKIETTVAIETRELLYTLIDIFCTWWKQIG